MAVVDCAKIVPDDTSDIEVVDLSSGRSYPRSSDVVSMFQEINATQNAYMEVDMLLDDEEDPSRGPRGDGNRDASGRGEMRRLLTRYSFVAVVFRVRIQTWRRVCLQQILVLLPPFLSCLLAEVAVYQI